jgi:hypothetical protein
VSCIPSDALSPRAVANGRPAKGRLADCQPHEAGTTAGYDFNSDFGSQRWGFRAGITLLLPQ